MAKLKIDFLTSIRGRKIPNCSHNIGLILNFQKKELFEKTISIEKNCG